MNVRPTFSLRLAQIVAASNDVLEGMKKKKPDSTKAIYRSNDASCQVFLHGFAEAINESKDGVDVMQK